MTQSVQILFCKKEPDFQVGFQVGKVSKQYFFVLFNMEILKWNV